MLPVFLLIAPIGPIIAIIWHMKFGKDATEDGEERAHYQSVDRLHSHSRPTQQELRTRRSIQERRFTEEQDITGESDGEALMASQHADMFELQPHRSTQGQDEMNTSDAPSRVEQAQTGVDTAPSDNVPHDLSLIEGICELSKSGLEVDGLRELLRSHGKQTRWMRQIFALAGLQLVLIAAAFLCFIFNGTGVRSKPIQPEYALVYPWGYLAVASQPMVCIYGVFIFLCTSHTHILRREFLCFPWVGWLLLASIMARYVTFFCIQEVGVFAWSLGLVPWEGIVLVPTTCLWLMGSGWMKWRGT